MTQHSLWRLESVSRFPVCYYIQFACWEVFCSFNSPPAPRPFSSNILRSLLFLNMYFTILNYFLLIIRIRLSFNDDICCSWRYLHCNLAVNTDWFVDVNKPITLVNSKINVAGSVSKFWHFVFTFCISSSVWDISRLTELIFSPKNSIKCTGVKTDFFPVHCKTQML